jgi:2-desacetyl-2-hydroxyethyl bacteriochlorophyllide A dehydrogenase
MTESHSLQVLKPGQMEIRPLERPAIGDHEALLRVAACGICGTDRHIYHGTFPATLPVVLGHEIAGWVVETGDKVTKVKTGDLVSVNPNIWCGRCQPCLEGQAHLCMNMKALGVDLNGGMAHYCAVPEQLLYKMKPDTDPLKACLAEPVSCVLHGIDRLRARAGCRAAVFGGGFIGQLMLQVLRLQGISEITLVEPVAYKRQIAERLGFRTIDPVHEREALEQLSELDVAIDCAGAGDVLAQCIRMTKRGGRVLVFAAYPQGKEVPIEPYAVYRKEISLIGSFTYPDTQLRAVRMIESGQLLLDPLITAVDLEQAMSLIKGEADSTVLKGVIKFA